MTPSDDRTWREGACDRGTDASSNYGWREKEKKAGRANRWPWCENKPDKSPGEPRQPGYDGVQGFQSTQNKLNTTFFYFTVVKIKWSNLSKWGEQKNLAVILASCHSYFAFVCLCEVLFPAQTPLCKQRRRDNWLTAQSAVASQASLIPQSGRSDWKMKDECSFPRECAGTLRLAVAPLCSLMGWGICFTKKTPQLRLSTKGSK